MSDIIFCDRQSRNRLPLQALSDESLCYDNIIENVNFETIKEIENQLKYLNDLSKNDESIFEISKVMSQFFKVLKRDYCDICLKLRNELSKNDKKVNLTKFKEKSNSLLSIVDIKMEIKDYDSLDKLVSNLDLNKGIDGKIENRFHSTPSVRIFKECAVNTEIENGDQATQTESCKTDKNFDSTQKFLYFRGQTNEVKNLIEVLQEKNTILEEKCAKSLNLLSLVNDKYRGYFEKLNSKKADFCENTCESWMMNYEKLVLDSNNLIDVSSELQIAQNRIRNLEMELSLLKVKSENQEVKIEELTEKNEKLTQEKQSMNNELNDTRDTNEFLNAEHQSLSVQMEKMQEDWNATIKLNEERLRKVRMDFRKENTQLRLEKQDMEFKFMQEHMHNSEDKMEVGFLEQRIEKLLQDISNYPLHGNELEKENKDLKKKISILEDKRIRHGQEKEKLKHYKTIMIDKVDGKSEELMKKINILQTVVTNLESDNQELRTRLDDFLKLCEDLRKINLNLENRDAEKCCDSFRTILSKFGA